MTKGERDDFLKAIVATGAHVEVAELDPNGRGRIEFHASDLDVREVTQLQQWLAQRPGITDISMSLAPDTEAPA